MEMLKLRKEQNCCELNLFVYMYRCFYQPLKDFSNPLIAQRFSTEHMRNFQMKMAGFGKTTKFFLEVFFDSNFLDNFPTQISRKLNKQCLRYREVFCSSMARIQAAFEL